VTAPGSDRSPYALAAIDAWLSAMAADRRPGDGRAKILRNRPADLRDGCWTPAGERVAEPLRWKGTGTCDTLYPSFADTRVAAGAPLRNDVLKCSEGPAAGRVPAWCL
jgi:hypothetical protein